MIAKLISGVAAFVWVTAFDSGAATYYVDYAAGSDSNNGTSMATPFQRAPGDTAATNRAASTALAPGDTIKFKGGVVYPNVVTVSRSGSSGSVITYDGNNAGDWGTGRAVIDRNYATTAFGFGSSRSHVTVKGFEIRNVGGYTDDDPIWTGKEFIADHATDVLTTTTPHGLSVGNSVGFRTTGTLSGGLPSGTTTYFVKTVPSATTLTITSTSGGATKDITTAGTGTHTLFKAVTAPPTGTAINVGTNAQHLRFENLYIHRVGQWRNVAPMSGTGSVSGLGIYIANSSDIAVVNCEFTKMKTGVAIKGTVDNISVTGCSFHNYMNWLIDVAPAGSNSALSNITIDGCDFYNYKEFDTPNWKGFGEKPHQDGIFFRTSGITSTWTNVVVKNSRWYSDTTSSGGTASIFISEGPSVDIYNCLFLNDQHSNAMLNVGYKKAGVTTQRVRVWNCTFVGGQKLLRVSFGNTNPDEIEIKNNIFYRTQSTQNLMPIEINRVSIGKLTMDHNLFFTDFTPATSAYMVYDGSYRSLAAWRTVSGQDDKSIQADPRFARVDGPPSGWDVALGAGSPARFRGANLSRHFKTDKAGVSRPEGDIPWTAGAYQAPPLSPGEPRVVERP